MTVEELAQRKLLLQMEVQNAIRRFVDDTGVRVEGIDVPFVDVTTLQDEFPRFILGHEGAHYCDENVPWPLPKDCSYRVFRRVTYRRTDLPEGVAALPLLGYEEVAS